MKIVFRVTGMTCAACSARVEKVTRGIKGVESAEVNLLSGKMTVQAADASVEEQIIAAVVKAGYGASTASSVRPKEQNSYAHMGYRVLTSAVFLIVLMYFGRVGVMTISLGFLMPDRAEERYRYAETNLLIG